MAENVTSNKVKQVSNFIKQSDKTLHLSLGEVTNLEQIGQGGNGLVYSGIQNGQEVALKFLVEDKQKSKLQRFKAEYFNVKLLNDQDNIVNYINYEELAIDGSSIPVIVMKKYEKPLKKLRDDADSVSEKVFIELFYFLINSLEKIHQKGIIHRDIKPENILVTKEGKFVLTDFGIASYNPDLYALKAKTEKRERLANYEFSAPEQAHKGAEAAPSMDIYAAAQVCQWYAFGTTHRGTNRSRVSSIFKSEEAEIIDVVLEKCLHNDYSNRYQSVNEILQEIERIKESRRTVDPFHEMYLLNDAIRATCPSVSRGVQYVEEEKYIKRLVENINQKNFSYNLWFNTGIGNSDFSKLVYLGNRKILVDYREIIIKGVWLFTGSSYDDLIILDTEENEPFVIDGEEVYYALVINDEHVVPSHYLDSGYVEIGEEVHRLKDLKVEEHDRSNRYKYYFIGTKFHSSIIFNNDSVLSDFQDKVDVDESTVIQLLRKLRRNKHEEVIYRL
ncbi:protein kinase [Halobacillus sp. HZG1]|uniref:protein kinase domain-containing protein n=1 Tax=Halobacillus sp. HZG1 TaxID=3111769 RepID=UPI002DBE0184|nr:protein kinase [Halobacillus sp. HZG1]MEC3883680.1 protein kinase [Halobacillus sp. HZG1]